MYNNTRCEIVIHHTKRSHDMTNPFKLNTNTNGSRISDLDVKHLSRKPRVLDLVLGVVMDTHCRGAPYTNEKAIKYFLVMANT